MAKTKYAPAADLTAGELHIHLHPGGWDSWLGTAEQLTDAGLIPASFIWPTNTNWHQFTRNGIDCSLQRKPRTGPKRGQPWAGVDNWHLMRYCASHGKGGADLHEKMQALRYALWRRSAEGERMAKLFWVAHNDAAFQAFKQRALG